MKKNLFALALAVCLLLVCVVCAQAEIVASGNCGAQGDNVTWTLDDEGNLVISGTGAMMNYSWDIPPWYNDPRIKNIQIRDGVTSIGYRAFYGCSNLASIIIPDSVTSIGGYVFYGCSSLTSIIIPAGVTNIGSYAFYGCSSLMSISIPVGITSIGNYMFWGCSRLSTIFIPVGVTSIGSSAFSYCSRLTTISIPVGVTSIGNSAFYGCNSLSSISIPVGVTSIGDFAFSYCSRLTIISFPDSIANIGYEAFYDCNDLVLDLSDNIEKVGIGAFSKVKSIYCTPHTQTAEHVLEFCIRGYEGFYLNEREHVINIQRYNGSRNLVYIPDCANSWSDSYSYTNVIFPHTLNASSSFSLYVTNATFQDGSTDLSGVTLRNVKKLSFLRMRRRCLILSETQNQRSIATWILRQNFGR